MSAVLSMHSDVKESIKFRCMTESDEPTIFTDVYRQDTNIIIWRRELSATFQQAIDKFLKTNCAFQTVMTVTPQNALNSISETLGDSASNAELSENITELVDMFCCLFGLKRAGLRLMILDRAMCPRFHVDRVPCRLVTTYQGAATQWLPHQVVDRTKLGAASHVNSDEQSGLFQSKDDIQQLRTGDVALLKGELWTGNENAGLVHRSPALSMGERRLLLTLDFIN
jgi:hypothetical protein